MEAKSLLIFEDDRVENLYPLTLTQAAFNLRLGNVTLGQRIARQFPALPVHYRCRPHLAAALRERTPRRPVNETPAGDALLVNARVFAAPDLAEHLPAEGAEEVVVHEGRLVAARVPAARIPSADVTITADTFRDLPRRELPVRWIDYLWDAIAQNEAAIREDFDFMSTGATFLVPDGAHVLGAGSVIIGVDTFLPPVCVLDATDGPIILGNNVELLPFSYIKGPCAIADGCQLRVGAKVHAGCSFGPQTKIGGEVTRTIVLGYTNKTHEGFVGDSYIGEWCNFGADTNTSNLKNTMSDVRVTLLAPTGGERVHETGRQFLGLLCGDHTRFGINTMLNTGTVCGAGCNIFGGGFPPKSIPSFSWGGAEGLEQYDFPRFVQMTRRAMERRGRELGEGEEALLKSIHDGLG